MRAIGPDDLDSKGVDFYNIDESLDKQGQEFKERKDTALTLISKLSSAKY